MMAETTPGPWTHSGRMVYAPGENGGNVCEVSEPRGSDYVEHVPVELGSKDREEAYANARLIAAAPDLLESARVLLNACYEADVREELAGEVDGSYMDAVGKAIAKASKGL